MPHLAAGSGIYPTAHSHCGESRGDAPRAKFGWKDTGLEKTRPCGTLRAEGEPEVQSCFIPQAQKKGAKLQNSRVSCSPFPRSARREPGMSPGAEPGTAEPPGSRASIPAPRHKHSGNENPGQVRASRISRPRPGSEIPRVLCLFFFLREERTHRGQRAKVTRQRGRP